MSAQGRSRREPVHGVLLLDKPRGCTSQQALQQARRALGAAKAGHTGTLDPLADGLLPLCFGAATKFAQMHLDADKAYRAQVHLGISTSTCDGEGEVTQRRPVPALHAGLRRTRSGGFELSQARPLEQVGQAGVDHARGWLLPPDSLVRELPELRLEDHEAAAMLHGRALDLPAARAPQHAGALRIYGAPLAGAAPLFLGVARWDGHELSVQRLLSSEELLTQTQTP